MFAFQLKMFLWELMPDTNYSLLWMGMECEIDEGVAV